jgi:hypothetical protein
MTGRGLVGRRTARFILLATIAMDAPLALLLLAPPNMMGGPMRIPTGIPLGTITLALGSVLNLVGLAWMIRIYRTNPEASRSSWRAFRHR